MAFLLIFIKKYDIISYKRNERKEKMLPRIKISLERWRFNKDYGLWVSNKGHVLDQYKQEVHVKVDKKGYLIVWSELATKLVKVHRLVLITWRPLDGMENLTVEHRDHNKRNNAINNLIWMTEEENIARGNEDYTVKKPKSTKRICANGVTMTVEEAVTFIYNTASFDKNWSKENVRSKINAVLNSDKQKKSAFGVTFTEVKS